MIFKQFYLSCLAQASYLIGDEDTRIAAVVDPRRDVDEYLAEAARQELQIRHVLLTHLHADFVAGHLELRNRTGAAIYLSSEAHAEYAFTPMADGQAIRFGRVRLRVLHTPGHTPESISIAVDDLARDEKNPYAVLTGDTLFIGDVGRPDLQASIGWTASDLGAMLYTSLREKLLPMPDATLVYPAHGAGSLCGKNLSSETVSTIGEQRRSNYALQPMSAEAFVAIVTADQPDAPAYFSYDAVMNTKEHPTLDAALRRELQPLTLDAVLDWQRRGADVLDVRDPNEFAEGHLAGSINIGLRGQYATWAGSVLAVSRPIVLISEPGQEEEGATRLGRIGFDNVVGYLDGGLLTLQDRPDLLKTTERGTAQDLAGELASPEPPFVLDVRTPREWAKSHLAGSVNRPLNHLAEQLADLPRGRRLWVHCAGGYRSSIAVSLLQRAGFADLVELAGGMAAWETWKLPLDRDPSAATP
jgi:hydroxyacylglutathione hydrolase